MPDELVQQSTPETTTPAPVDDAAYWRSKANEAQNQLREIAKATNGLPPEEIRNRLQQAVNQQEIADAIERVKTETAAQVAQQYQGQLKQVATEKQQLENAVVLRDVYQEFQKEFVAENGRPVVADRVFRELLDERMLDRGQDGKLIIVDPSTRQPRLDDQGQPIDLKKAFALMKTNERYQGDFAPVNNSQGSNLRGQQRRGGTGRDTLTVGPNGEIIGVSLENLQKGNFDMV